jgi:hypothetical protein
MALKILAGVSLLVWTSSGQQACARSAPSGTVVAPGFTARKLATVVNPRSMTFDKEGRLLVVSAKAFTKNNAGSVEALILSENNGCVTVASKSTVLRQNTVRIQSMKCSKITSLLLGRVTFSNN